MNKIENMENMELVDTIVLNGIIGYCNTHDENSDIIGVKNIRKIVTFKGETIVTETDGFPLTQKMADKIGWMDYHASVKLVTGKTPIDPTKVEETIIESIYGDAEANYSHEYSDLTGYLWTDEKFKVGGHSIPDILTSHKGEYIHMEIELYKLKRK